MPFVKDEGALFCISERTPYSGRKEGEPDPNADKDNPKGTFSPRMKKYTYAFVSFPLMCCADACVLLLSV